MHRHPAQRLAPGQWPSSVLQRLKCDFKYLSAKSHSDQHSSKAAMGVKRFCPQEGQGHAASSSLLTKALATAWGSEGRNGGKTY